MSNGKKKFDHKEGNIFDAIGVSEDRVDEIQDEMNTITQESDKFSEVIETFAERFSPVELAYCVVTLHRNLCQMHDEMQMSESSTRAIGKLKSLLEEKFGESRRKSDDPLREGGSMWFGKGEA